MPIKKSAKKALRQTKKRTRRNRKIKRRLAELKKELLREVAVGKPETTQVLLRQLTQALDKTAKVGVIKKNTAGRYKSRLSKLAKNAPKTG